MVTSGLRIGTPALAARGFGPSDFIAVADIIAEALTAQPDTDTSEIATRVTALTEKHPLYPNLS